MQLIVIAVILFVAAATANPLYGNEEEIERVEDIPIKGKDKEEDWHMIPDTNGKLHLVDINSIDTEIEPLFNAMNDVIFRLFTRRNSLSQTIRINNNNDLANSNFNPARPVRFHIHGWQGGGVFTGRSIRQAWLDQIDCNVITVDWGAGAQTINYVAARNRVNAVGAVVAQFIDWLNTRTSVPFSTITVIGHSLGGHIAGATGKRVIRGRLQAVLAMDPAGPLFSIRSPEDRVHHTDANHVEVMYTDAGGLGFDEPLGHANFYPNWGTRQPGCGIDLSGLCSHNIVEDFFEASINPRNVIGATRCNSFNAVRLRRCIDSGPSRRMGGEPVMDGSSPVGAVYFLETNSRSPFAQGAR